MAHSHGSPHDNTIWKFPSHPAVQFFASSSAMEHHDISTFWYIGMLQTMIMALWRVSGFSGVYRQPQWQGWSLPWLKASICAFQASILSPSYLWTQQHNQTCMGDDRMEISKLYSLKGAWPPLPCHAWCYPPDMLTIDKAYSRYHNCIFLRRWFSISRSKEYPFQQDEFPWTNSSIWI